jgi:hypothetical protein
MKAVRNLAPFIILSFLLLSCGGDKKDKSFILKDIEFVYEGPLYEGSNPAQYVAAIDLKSIFKEDYKEGMTIENALLKKAEVVPGELSSFGGISALVLSLSADNPEIKMQELAVLNPIDSTASKAVLKPSPKADATDFFGEKQFYVVLDATLAKDIETGLKLKGNFEFELTYK